MAVQYTYEELKQKVQKLEQEAVMRKQAEKALRESEHKLNTHLLNTPIGAISWDLNFSVVEWNPAAETIFGYSKAEAMNKHATELILPEETKEMVDDIFRDLISEKGGVRSTNENVIKDGSRIICDWYNTTLKDADGNVVGVASLVHDVTKRKQSEEVLRTSEKEHRSTLNNLLIGVVVHASDTSILFSNSEATNILGLTYEQMSGKKTIDPSWNFVHEDFTIMEVADYPVNKVVSTKKPIYDYALGVKRPDRDYITWTIVNAIPVFVNDGELDKVIVNFIDHTDRKQAEQLLLESEARFKALHNASFGGICIHDKGIILECNQGLSDITGYFVDELIGMDGLLLIGKQSRQMVMDKILSGYEKPYEAIGLRKNGDEFPIRLEARNIPYKGKSVRAVEFRDISEQKKAEQDRKKLQDQLTQAQKMESMGRLAAGMAHEINNPLAGIIQNATVLSNRLTDKNIPANIKAAQSVGTTMESINTYMASRAIHRMIKAIKDSASRMASIVENTLSFVRKTDASFSSHNPAELVDNVLELANTDYDLKKEYDFKSISIQKEYEKHLPMIVCEGSKIQQVLLNILNNGAHAMFEREKNDGTPDPQFILRLSLKTDSDMLQIEIEDNGTGMDEDTREKIFEPFFTTKPFGSGTGLGMSVSYFIITENHGGTLDVISEQGKGTNFIIRLPLKR